MRNPRTTVRMLDEERLWQWVGNGRPTEQHRCGKLALTSSALSDGMDFTWARERPYSFESRDLPKGSRGRSSQGKSKIGRRRPVNFLDLPHFTNPHSTAQLELRRWRIVTPYIFARARVIHLCQIRTA